MQGALKDSKEFRRLEELVSQIQQSIMFKSESSFSAADKQLIRELFGMQPGEPDEVAEKLNELREESNQLYFELRTEYDHEQELLRRQKEHLRQLQDFAKAILTVDDDRANQVLGHQKRAKAPLYSNLEQLLQETQQRIDDLEQKQRGMDRLSLAKGIEKYEDAFKIGSRKGSVNSQKLSSPANFKRKSNQPKELREASPMNQSMFAAPQKVFEQAKALGGTMPAHHRKKSTMSDVGQNFLKDAVADPQFIEELMADSNAGGPSILVDRTS